MVDFVQNSTIKSAVRNLANPITYVAAFDAIIQSVILNNPFGCVSYMNSGVNHPPVEKTRETYTAKFVYQDAEARRVGAGSEMYDSVAGFNAGISAVLSNSANVTAHRGSVVRDEEADTYAVTLKCHDPNGEMYNVSLSRNRVTISSYSDDAIRIRVETWADGVPALT
jgi:hypothetical protein